MIDIKQYSGGISLITANTAVLAHKGKKEEQLLLSSHHWSLHRRRQIASYERLRFVRLPPELLPKGLCGERLLSYWPCLIYSSLTEFISDINPRDISKLTKGKLLVEHIKLKEEAEYSIACLLGSPESTGVIDEEKISMIVLPVSRDEDDDGGEIGDNLVNFIDHQHEFESFCEHYMDGMHANANNCKESGMNKNVCPLDTDIIANSSQHVYLFLSAVDVALNCLAEGVGCSDLLPIRKYNDVVLLNRQKHANRNVDSRKGLCEKSNSYESSSSAGNDDGNSSMLCQAGSYQTKKLLVNAFNHCADENVPTSLKDNPDLNEKVTKTDSKVKSSMNNNNCKRRKLEKVAPRMAVPKATIASTMKTASSTAATIAPPRTPTGCSTKPQDPSKPLQASKSIPSNTSRGERYDWSNVWPFLRSLGWKVIKAGKYNVLHDWYYVPPNCNPADSRTILGKHYFMSQSDLINFVKRNDKDNGL